MGVNLQYQNLFSYACYSSDSWMKNYFLLISFLIFTSFFSATFLPFLQVSVIFANFWWVSNEIFICAIYTIFIISGVLSREFLLIYLCIFRHYLTRDWTNNFQMSFIRTFVSQRTLLCILDLNLMPVHSLQYFFSSHMVLIYVIGWFEHKKKLTVMKVDDHLKRNNFLGNK